MSRRFENTAVLLTGAGRGIGRGTALRFASEGASLLLSDVNADDCASVVAEVRAAGGTARSIKADLSRREEAYRLVEETAAALGTIDVLVHNAGVYPFMSLEHLDDATLDLTLAVNLKACFWLTQAALSYLKQAAGGGRIVVTASSAGTDSVVPGLGHYSASKAGAVAFVRNAALELAPYGIRVNGIRPGFITHEVTQRMGVSNEAVQRLGHRIPAGRTGTPDDIARAILYFASTDSEYITGQTMLVDGGLHLKSVIGIEDERDA